ncbi:MAG: J domain-containing protein [Burkholderiaceae bacterium]|jgi:curved DNA-binding protein CbpA|nr:J domain-containing protein [Burkholderiaceae bacterium]
MKDLYQVLGLLHTAENEVIKAAYKALAQKYHPDRHPEKKLLYTEIMAELNQAHDMLGNARKRKEFDAAWKKFTDKRPKLEEPLQQPSPAPQPPPAKPSGQHDTMLSHLASNRIDEFQMMHLYEELFGNTLTIQHGWTNHYVHKLGGKEIRYSFTELKNLIIEKLKAS